MRDEVLAFLRQNAGKFVSGQHMSEACKVTRTAIWKHIQNLRKQGYKIESFTKKGYRLLEEPDLLLPAAINKRLETKTFGREYHYFDQLPSSNKELRKLADAGAAEGAVVVTESQVSGHGRLNRGWYSPHAKGLWFSLLLRPSFVPQEAPKCTLMAAVALTKAFHELGLSEAGIKWPNDILVHGRKLVGILTEMNGSMEQIDYIIMGIGINTGSTKDEFPEDIREIATSFAMEGVDVDRCQALALILKHLEDQYQKVLKEGFASTLEEWKKLSVTINQDVEVRAPGNTYEGLALDLDQDGNLLVKTKTGQIERIVAGDVSIRPAKKK